MSSMALGDWRSRSPMEQVGSAAVGGPSNDLAVIKIDAPVEKYGNSARFLKLLVGQKVLVIGSHSGSIGPDGQYQFPGAIDPG
jgi:S1-C subfamily serine protease